MPSPARFARLLLFSSLGVAALPGCKARPRPSPDAPLVLEPAPAPLQTAVDELARQVLADDWGLGLAVGVIDGPHAYLLSYGTTRRGAAFGPDADTVFEIGSVTKLVTGILLADLSLSGRVRLDDPVQRLLPAGVKMPTRDGVDVTLEHLATHTSGLPRDADACKGDRVTRAALFACATAATLEARPGRVFIYSNLGASLLAELMAEKSGTSFEALALERVTGPAGMTRTRVVPTAEMTAALAQGYEADGPAMPLYGDSAMAGAGALLSTPRDMLRFLRLSLWPDGSPLGRAVRLAEEPRHDTDEKGEQVGLAWHVDTKGRLWHNGQTNGFHAFIGLDRERGVGVVVLGNVATLAGTNFGRAVLAHLCQEPANLNLPKSIALSEDVLERYVGSYGQAGEVALVVARAGTFLTAASKGDKPRRMDPESPTLFHFRNAPVIRVEFGGGENGRPQKLFLRLKTRTLEFDRLADRPPPGPTP